LLVVFLRRGIVGAIDDLYRMARSSKKTAEPVATPSQTKAAMVEAMPARRRDGAQTAGPILQATGLTKRYGGLAANSDIDFSVDHGEMRGIIGPNGAGKSTFFKMLTCEVEPSAGKIV